jgi:type I restriction-modification system DNA methylase subunit
MTTDRKTIIEAYRQKIKQANKEATKKEIFKDLLHDLYAGDKEIRTTIDAISAGAERTVLNIPRRNKNHRGSADTLYNNIIIEFENDLRTSLKHAKEQLAGYLLGEMRTGKGYNYTLIVSDFINWRRVSPDPSQFDKLDMLQEDDLMLIDDPSASFTLTEHNGEDFYYWIDRFLFKEVKQKASLRGIEEAFGYRSSTFIECFRQITAVFQDAKKYGEVQVSYEQWRKFLSIAYGSFNDSDSAFIIHTYLSVLAKVLAYEVLSNDDYVDDAEMKGVLEGTIFHKYNIRNFVDNDFFHWVHSDRYFQKLKGAFRIMAQEISTFDFEQVDEDVLKGVYQDLIDLDTRHALGEYYTPDWLCERVVQEFDFKKPDRILDPSCGSGSFLRAAIHRQRTLNPGISIEELNASIYGIDIHPLSVQIAKTTVLIALGKDLKKVKKQIYLNIILANTLLAPDGAKELFGSTFRMEIDKEKLILTSQILSDVSLFDDGLHVCEDLAVFSEGKKAESPATLEKRLHQLHGNGGYTPAVIDSFHKIYLSLKKVKEKGRDSIWKFIVQNLYKPYFLAGKIDYIIGNPPWFTYSSIKNEEYQDTLNRLAEKYDVKPEKVKNFPHLEIAAIFLAYCNSYFLKDTGKLGFVLPRSFFSADHHDNTRSGKAKHLFITDVWDLNDVSPLFRIPSCVIFSEKKGPGFPKGYTSKGINGLVIKGRVPSHNCNWTDAKDKLTTEEVKWYYIKQGKSSALSTKKQKTKSAVNPYMQEFKQGATIVPRTLYFVDVDMAYERGWEKDFDWSDRVINLKTANHIKADAKMPWRELILRGFMDSRFIFRTALSKNILPFFLYKPDLVVLPIDIDLKEETKYIKMLSINEIYRMGHSDASKWFRKAENFWNIYKTEKNKKITSADYLNWQGKLTSQNLNAKYLVIYNASAKDANSTIVERSKMDLEFIVESTAYVFYTDALEEALYLTAILNSSVPNEMMKAFQATGLFGPRHVHKKILDVYFPKYDDSDTIHQQLAELGRDCHERAAAYIISHTPQQELSGIHLGKLRTDIKKHLAPQMKEIDKLVKRVIG